MKKSFIYLVFFFYAFAVIGQQTQQIYLSGTGNDNTKTWDFYCTGGRNSKKWTKIEVPSCWELQGFGKYNYGNDFRKLKNDPDFEIGDEQGIYKYDFFAEKDWKNKQVEIVFEGSMTDTKVEINGKLAGEIHQGSFYRFSYDISDLLKYGENNNLKVTVSKVSANKSVTIAERYADYWIFGGIFRPVYLRIKPEEHIVRTAIDAKANGSFYADIYLKNIKKADVVELQIQDAKGNPVGQSAEKEIERGSEKLTITTKLENPKTWTAEFPHLYSVKFVLKNGDKVVHQTSERFGFRTMEFKEGVGIFVNGQKIVFKGVNRHSFYPSSGRTTNKDLSIQDVELMKDMNMNAVRMSHYPPDKHFLEVCDSLGLYVLNELAGWQYPPYDTEVGRKLVKEMVTRDVNHPCIIFWDNGNEGGWNYELDEEFARYDPQNRQVLHPWSVFKGIDTQHYKPYGYGAQTFMNGDKVFFPTEFLHGLYDGGHGAGLEDYWNLMMQNEMAGGGFLWVFSDEAVVRTDKNGILDADGNHAPDGIVGPYREKEGSFFAIKEIWSPVQIHHKVVNKYFNGLLKVENLYHHTNLNQCKLEWKLIKFPYLFENNTQVKLVDSGEIEIPSIKPQTTDFIVIDLPENWYQKSDMLSLTATDPHGREIYTWTWNIAKETDMESVIKNSKEKGEFTVEKSNNKILIGVKQKKFIFDEGTGILKNVIIDNTQEVAFNNGPMPAFDTLSVTNIETRYEDGKQIIHVECDKIMHFFTWTIHPEGWLQLDYEYHPWGSFDFCGINFDYPESGVEKIQWIGHGPYRVWKNREAGAELNLWEKDYNNTITGKTWEYPEFKGYHSGFQQAKLQSVNENIYILCQDKNIYLRLFTPEFPEDARTATAPFPDGDISFLNAISPIGTKFHKASNLGPQGEKNFYINWGRTTQPFKNTLFFYFEKK